MIAREYGPLPTGSIALSINSKKSGEKTLAMTTTQPVSYAELLERAKSLQDQISAWRREIHRYPELTFTEQRTAGLVNATLVSLGIPTETEVAKTGVVGHIEGGAGPLIGLRAD